MPRRALVDRLRRKGLVSVDTPRAAFGVGLQEDRSPVTSVVLDVTGGLSPYQTCGSRGLVRAVNVVLLALGPFFRATRGTLQLIDGELYALVLSQLQDLLGSFGSRNFAFYSSVRSS